MNLIPHKISSREHATEPLHQLLLNFGKGLWQWPLKSSHHDVADEMLLVQHADNVALHNRARELTIKQLAMTLRMRHEDIDELAMIMSLESLVTAGEIGFNDFIGRAHNLFPQTMASLDVTLRMKIASLTL